MKLRTKLFVNFGIILFLAINLFSYFLIESTFSDTLQRVIDSSFSEYEIIYSNIKTAENLQNLFLTNKEILEIKSKDYLSSNYNKNRILQFRDLKGDMIYSSSIKKFDLNNEIYNLEESNYKYMIVENLNSKYIVINSFISLNSTTFSFMYFNDITEVYTSKDFNINNAIKLNIILGLILSLILYLVTLEITRPIELLIIKIDKIIKGNYNEKINSVSNISEISAIYKNFNLMNNEIQNKIQDLENENLKKQRFIDNLTHEIRTPLTSIIGYSSLILNKNITDKDVIHNSLEVINNDGKRILSLTSNLVKLITFNKKELNIQEISIFSVIKDIERSFAIKLIENKINFSVIGEDYIINTDKALIIILISNFLDNSIKAVSNTKVKNISITLNNNEVIIEDTGEGIAKDDISKIFEPFYTVDASRDKSINGFGLGLSICQEIIKLLNIKFDIKSNLNEGTKISLLFYKEVQL